MSTIRVNTLQNTSGVEVYTAKAWVNFNGTGTVAIRASGNVSSITDGGVGNYSVNFTTAMTDTNYSVVAMAYLNEAGTTYANAVGRSNTTSSTLLTAIQAGTALTLVDSSNMQVAIFR
jgi:hypothetical protein